MKFIHQMIIAITAALCLLTLSVLVASRERLRRAKGDMSRKLSGEYGSRQTFESNRQIRRPERRLLNSAPGGRGGDSGRGGRDGGGRGRGRGGRDGGGRGRGGGGHRRGDGAT